MDNQEECIYNSAPFFAYDIPLGQNIICLSTFLFNLQNNIYPLNQLD